MAYKDNKGLIAVQNKDCRMAFENALKSYSATISGVNGDKKLLKLLLGKEDYELLVEIGLTQFCYQKTEELYQKYPFPSEIKQLPQSALKSEADEREASELGEGKIKEDEERKANEQFDLLKVETL